MRVFVSVHVPTEVREKLREVQKELPKNTKLVPVENFHITLSFLGEKSQDKVKELIEKLSLVQFKPFVVKLVGIGGFTSSKKARVVWIGVQSVELEKLARQVKLAVGDEEFKFKAHVTLARDVEIDLTTLANRLEKKEFGVFEVKSFELMKSELTPSSSKYSVLESFSLTV